MTRATRSFEPPAANGTISVIGLDGYVCACAAALASASAAASNTPVLIMIGVSPRRMLW